MSVDPANPDPRSIHRAAELLKSGRLVAFPTETVYGLGANALSQEAVAAIFLAKGRPAFNPLIVHLPDVASARRLTSEWPDAAQRLAAEFWPGPLSLVLRKANRVPDVVTGGRATVAIRVPENPVALALLRATALPIAAPSANRSEQLSPTTAQHVYRSLAGRIPLIVDGGPTTGGIESTVVAITDRGVRLLRPGPITPAEIEAVVGPIYRSDVDTAGESEYASPGMMLRHYAPRATLQLQENPLSLVEELVRSGERVGWLALDHLPDIKTVEDLNKLNATEHSLVLVRMPLAPSGYANALYAVLHNLDEIGVTRIVVEEPPNTEPWLAIRDRLMRAQVKRL